MKNSKYSAIGRYLNDRENLLFAALVVISLVPLWVFKYFPSSDGFSRLENAVIIRDFFSAEHNIFRQFYTINVCLPTWVGHLILAGLSYILPLLIAEKLFLSIYIILFLYLCDTRLNQ